MLVVTKAYTHLNKPASLSWSMYDLLLPPDVKGLKSVKNKLSKNHTKSGASYWLCSLKKLLKNFFGKFLENHSKQSTYWKLVTMNREYELWTWVLSQMFFLEFLKNFQNSYVKEQLHFHVGTPKETDGLLKDLREYFKDTIEDYFCYCQTLF